jgi:ABC-type multidrug transport system fused ATPase/permease subunit
MTNTALYRRLLSHVKPYRRIFALGITGMVVLAATEPVLPALMKPLIEGTFIDRDPAIIRWIPVVIVGLYLVRGLATYVASYAMGWVGKPRRRGPAQRDVREASRGARLVLRRAAVGAASSPSSLST